MTKTAILLAGTALALAACTPPTPRHHGEHWGDDAKSISKLDCPDSQGALRRQSAATDGRTCIYTDDAGAEVTLQIVSLEGTDAKTALAPLETQLKAELPVRTPKPEPAASGDDDRDNVNIDLPGIHIHAKGNGGAQVQAGHVDINAGENGAQVRVRKDATGDDGDGKGASHGGEGVTVDADESGAEVHVDASKRHGLQMTLILASQTPGPKGYKLAGYEARGPRGGPLVVASVKAKTENRDSLYHDMRVLLSRNAG